jgi:hypothetical protein
MTCIKKSNYWNSYIANKHDDDLLTMPLWYKLEIKSISQSIYVHLHSDTDRRADFLGYSTQCIVYSLSSIKQLIRSSWRGQHHVLTHLRWCKHDYMLRYQDKASQRQPNDSLDDTLTPPHRRLWIRNLL